MYVSIYLYVLYNGLYHMTSGILEEEERNSNVFYKKHLSKHFYKKHLSKHLFFI